MANTYYDSQLTAAEIEAALEAISGLIVPANNGKVIAINNGKFEARSVQWGGGSAVVEPLSVTQNGTYNPPSGVDGYAPVTVSVPSGGSILTGESAPSSDLGNDGDIYKRVIPIPSSVNFVEYLQSSGTQYIDTGIIADMYTDFDAKVAMMGNEWVFGSRSSLLSNAFFVTGNGSGYIGAAKYQSANAFDNDSGLLISANIGDFVTIKTNTTVPKDDLNFISVAYSIKKGIVSSRRIHLPNSFTSAFTQVLFGMNNNGTKTGGVARIYRVTYYQAREPIADYLPCLDGNGTPCMWDNIAEEYVYNDGTGSFTYGSSAVPTPIDDVYYLKENGAWHVIQQ